MKVTVQLCCKVISVFICVCGLLNLCIAAPMGSYYDANEDNEMTNTQRMQLLKDLRQMIEQEDSVRAAELKRFELGGAGPRGGSGGESSGLYRVLPQVPQKRFRPFRTQTRAGGVALCLWKVCPAAPWLVSKRR